MRSLANFLVGSAFAFLSICGSEAIGAPVYAVTDLGALIGAGSAYGLNSWGEVTGMTYKNRSAFLFDGTQVHSLGTLPLDLFGAGGLSSSMGLGINDHGQVAGTSTFHSDFDDSTTRHAFVYDGSKLKDLGTLGGVNSQAMAINDAGVVVGASDTSMRVPPGSATSGAPIVRAFMYKTGDGMIDLGTVNGFTDSYARSINSAGWVTGSVSTPYSQRAFIFDGVSMELIPSLPGNSTGADINADGWVVGTANGRAFVYRDGQVVDLGTGFMSSSANSINDSGDIVGHAYSARSFAMYSDGASVWDLNDLLDASNSSWYIGDAISINNAGQILAIGSQGLASHTLLLTPIPEPEISALFGFGMGTLLLLARRRLSAGA